jgi:protein ImuA
MSAATLSIDSGLLKGVWRAGELAAVAGRTLDTGYPLLNSALPGGGWPVGAMTELLQRRPGCGEWGLLAPALASLHAAAGPPAAVTLIGAPHQPFGPALIARHVEPLGWLRVQTQTPTERLWSAEQALRCAAVSVVLLWLPRVEASHLRRLHLAAQTHGKLLFVFRPESAQNESSPAPLRLHLSWLSAQQGRAAPALQVQLLKRRGPPLAHALTLETATPRLQSLLLASRVQSALRRQASTPVQPRHEPHDQLRVKDRSHAVDRLASTA